MAWWFATYNAGFVAAILECAWSSRETLIAVTCRVADGALVVRSWRFLGGVGVGFFCPTPDVQLDYFSHHTPKLEIPVEMVQFLLKYLLKQGFLAVYHDCH